MPSVIVEVQQTLRVLAVPHRCIEEGKNPAEIVPDALGAVQQLVADVRDIVVAIEVAAQRLVAGARAPVRPEHETGARAARLPGFYTRAALHARAAHGVAAYINGGDPGGEQDAAGLERAARGAPHGGP